VRSMGRSWGQDAHVADDVLQQALLHLFQRELKGGHVRSRERWIIRVADGLLKDIGAGRKRSVGPMREAQGGAAGLDAAEAARVVEDPAVRAEARDMFRALPELLHRLPPPYAHVAWLQHVSGWSRAAITEWLCSWGTVVASSCPRIFIRAHAMERLLLDGGSPRETWPKSYDPEENPWCLLPLPPLEGL